MILAATGCAPAQEDTDGPGPDVTDPPVVRPDGPEVDPGPPQNIDLYTPTKEEVERRLREAREETERRRLAEEAAAKADREPPVVGPGPETVTPDTTTQPVVAPVIAPVTPDVVHIPDRGDVQARRPLDAGLVRLLTHLQNNDIRSASRELKKLDVEKLVPQDRFLLQSLQAYIYFRLGRDETALELVGKLYDDLELTMPLRIEQLEIVRGPLKSIRYGKFRTVDRPVYRQGSIVYLYLQPDNYVQVKDGDMWRVSLEVDFTLKDSRGNIINRMEMVSGNAFEKGCNEVLGNDRNRNRRSDVYYGFGVPLPKRLNPMEYTLEVVLRDKNTKPRKETRSSVTFTLE